MVRTAALLTLVLFAAGCSNAESQAPPLEGDCEAKLIWEESTYDGSHPREPLTPARRLPEGVLPECAPDPERTVEVKAVHGIDPAVALLTPGPAEVYPGSDMVWLGPGYLLQSRLHPLHEVVDWGQDNHGPNEWDCNSPVTVDVRVEERPSAFAQTLHVTADEETEAFIKGDDVDSYLVLEPDTTLKGFNRDGIPFIDAGMDVTATVRECIGRDDDPGLNGLRLVVAETIQAAD